MEAARDDRDQMIRDLIERAAALTIRNRRLASASTDARLHLDAALEPARAVARTRRHSPQDEEP